jgi:hypothetical protein
MFNFNVIKSLNNYNPFRAQTTRASENVKLAINAAHPKLKISIDLFLI